MLSKTLDFVIFLVAALLPLLQTIRLVARFALGLLPMSNEQRNLHIIWHLTTY